MAFNLALPNYIDPSIRPTVQPASPTPPDPTARPSIPERGRDTSGPVIPGGIYTGHSPLGGGGPPAGLTCPAGQTPQEVPAGSGFWRCAPSSTQPAAPATPTPAPTPPSSNPDPFGSTATNTSGAGNASADLTNRLLDLVAAQYAGAGANSGGTGGLATAPVGAGTDTTAATGTATTSGGSKAGLIIVLILVAGLGYWWYKKHHKKKEGA